MSLKLREKLEIETRFAALGEIPTDAMTDVYRARVIDRDFVKADALVLSNTSGVDLFDQLRTCLSRGDLAHAAHLLDRVRQSSDASDEYKIETLLEASRLASFEGDWTACERLSQTALQMGPTGITQLALRQVHATSLIELGRLTEARREVDLALILAKLFPHSHLALYVAATEARLLVRLRAFAKAQSTLAKIWKHQPSPSVDICVVLLRIELELRRSLHQPTESVVFAIWMLCRRGGDRLYEALAVCEMEMDFAAASERANGWSEVLASAQTFARAHRQGFHSSSNPPPHSVETFDQLTHVALERQNLLIDLQAMSARKIDLTPQLWRALRELNLAPLSRETYFMKLWSQRFSADLHDDVIRRVLYRLRRATGLEIKVASGSIRLPTTWVVPA